MTQKEALERIYKALPDDVTGIKLYVLTGKENDQKSYLLVGAGKKFEDEITMPISELLYDAIKDLFPSSTTSFISMLVPIETLSVAYRKHVLDELIETLT